MAAATLTASHTQVFWGWQLKTSACRAEETTDTETRSTCDLMQACVVINQCFHGSAGGHGQQVELRGQGTCKRVQNVAVYAWTYMKLFPRECLQRESHQGDPHLHFPGRFPLKIELDYNIHMLQPLKKREAMDRASKEQPIAYQNVNCCCTIFLACLYMPAIL